MTEIPEHLLRRAEESRRRAAADKAGNPEVDIPPHLLSRVRAVERARDAGITGDELLLPGEPFSPPLTPAERERIAVILVNLRASTDEAITNLLTSAKEASDRAQEAQVALEKRRRHALALAVVGTFAVTILLVFILVMLSGRFG